MKNLFMSDRHIQALLYIKNSMESVKKKGAALVKRDPHIFTEFKTVLPVKYTGYAVKV
jgi:hypothetical protein